MGVNTAMIDILLYAGIAGVILAAICGPLGVMVTWQRMAYYGDTLAHSALLGVALGLALQINMQVAVLLACLLIAATLFALQLWRDTALDSLLGILSHSSLALGLVCLSFIDGPGFDLNAFLFGDLLSVMRDDLYLLTAIGGAALTLLVLFWGDMLSVIAHAELAAVEGIKVQRLRLLLMLLIAATVAVAMKIVGVLLISAMLIIPASAAGRIARSPEQSAFWATVFGIAAVFIGLAAAWRLDTPAGPSIVLTAGLIFILSHFIPGARRGR